MNVLPVTSYAKDKKDVEDTAVGGIERDYIYRDARNENTNVIHADYAEMYGMEDEEYQEKINFCIQRMMLDDVFLKLEKK